MSDTMVKILWKKKSDIVSVEGTRAITVRATQQQPMDRGELAIETKSEIDTTNVHQLSGVPQEVQGICAM